MNIVHESKILALLEADLKRFVLKDMCERYMIPLEVAKKAIEESKKPGEDDGPLLASELRGNE